MKLNKDIDLGKSFEKLKSALLSSTRSIKRDQPATYAYAFGRLETAVKILFVQCTDLTMKDIQDELEGPEVQDDIPSQLFSGKAGREDKDYSLLNSHDK